MSAPPRDDSPEYLAERVHQAVATDPRTNEQGVQVRVTDAELFLYGEVASAERREAVAEVAAEVVADRRIHNDITVVRLGDEHTPERIT
jgi:osmotically-inducible protein OsmY